VLTSSIKERKNYGWTVVGVGIGVRRIAFAG